MARRPQNRLERKEISIIKAMIQRGDYNDQDILAYFTRPCRTINHARISDIRRNRTHANVTPASEEELEDFFRNWPNYDVVTGLSPDTDELVIKAREAMIAAVHTFNSAGITFRAELFIVASIIAWTYLLHAWFRKNGIEYRHIVRGQVQITREGAEKYLELGACLRHARSPVSEGVKRNLEFLISIRHEIEHRSTNRIDEALSAKLQACCINFNNAIKDWFGAQCGLDRRLPIALQFSTFDVGQRSLLKKEASLPTNISATIDRFERHLTEENYGDPAYRYRVAFVPVVKQRASAADVSVEFIAPDSQKADDINQVLLREVDRIRYTSTQIVEQINEMGFPNFNISHHTRLWKTLNAKREGTQYGRKGDYRNSWVWFEPWLERVRAHCEEQGHLYR